MGFIYYIENIVNKKGYVGQTTGTVERRWQQHISLAIRGEGYLLGQAIRKYGIESFKIEQIACVENIHLNDLEIHYIKLFGTYRSLKRGYNSSYGADGATGSITSMETRLKQSLAKKGIKLSPQHIANAVLAKKIKGKKRVSPSVETRIKIAAANRGKKMSASNKAKLIAANTGKKRSFETKIKIGIANKLKNKGKPWSIARKLAQVARHGS